MKKFSVEDKVKIADGHPAGFDYMRLILSICVVVSHACVTGYGREADYRMFDLFPPVRLILPMFFALSGYLVASSLERSKTLEMFLALRAIRIYPALFVEVVLSAFILGPLVTTLSAHSYFTDPLFYSYLLNAVGDIHYALPGVFGTNPLPGIVNGQLWTVPYELFCYISISVITIVGVRKHRIIAPIATVCVVIWYFAWTAFQQGWQLDVIRGPIQGGIQVAVFLAGVTVYFYRKDLPWSCAFGGAALIATLIILSFDPYGDLFLPFPVAYATVFLGVTNPSRKYLRGADYSYGIFLYGFAIQQSIVFLLPAARVWYVNITLTLPAAFLAAAFSWHLVEAQAARLKPFLKKAETRYLNSGFAPFR